MADLTSNIAADAPPDWEARSSELLCPLCKYNLRGLTSPRCPECGFAFAWAELIEAEKNKHKYLFEHAKGLGFKSFWKTYWRTAWPRRFWSDLNPAQPVRLVRLILYWLMANAILVGVMIALDSRIITAAVKSAVNDASITLSARAAMKARALSMPGAAAFFNTHPGELEKQLDHYCPLPWSVRFWTQEIGSWSRYSFRYSRSYYRWGSNDPSPLYWSVVIVAWPWLTLASLVIFRASMRQASIRSVHLLRTVIYSCDAGLVFGIAFLIASFIDSNLADGWLTMPALFVCAAITTYRLTLAFRQYLRVHLPFATVLASQLIALLIVFLLLVQIADFSRRV